MVAVEPARASRLHSGEAGCHRRTTAQAKGRHTHGLNTMPAETTLIRVEILLESVSPVGL